MNASGTMLRNADIAAHIRPDARGASGPRVDHGDGRRIYIHARSFAWLAAAEPNRAEEVYGAILSASAIKRLHHAVQDALAPGLSGPEARVGAEIVTRLQGDRITGLLRSLGYAPRQPRHRYNILRVLELQEGVEATCFDGGYYTFATTAPAARRMYADTVPMRALRAAMEAGSPGGELTVISGHSLVFLRNPDDGGPQRRAAYAALLDEPSLSLAASARVASSIEALREGFPRGAIREVVPAGCAAALERTWNEALDDLAQVRFG